MPTWICDVVGTRPDGSFTWRRHGASEPHGVLPTVLAPRGTEVGRQVVISATRDWSGHWTVLDCQLVPTAEPDERQLLAEPAKPRTLACGQLRWTTVLNPLEDPLSTGKERPAMLVSDLGQSWRVMGLTTKNHYEDGRPRTAIPDHLAVGLHAPGYLWGDRLTRVRTTDIGEFIGMADNSLIDAVVTLARADLTSAELDDLTTLRRS